MYVRNVLMDCEEMRNIDGTSVRSLDRLGITDPPQLCARANLSLTKGTVVLSAAKALASSRLDRRIPQLRATYDGSKPFVTFPWSERGGTVRSFHRFALGPSIASRWVLRFRSG
jgi:hypothetical protein